MSATRAHDEYLYYLIFGSGYIDNPWSGIWGHNDYANDYWQLFVRPTPQASNVGLVDMSNHDVSAISIVTTQTYSYSSGNLVYAQDTGVQDMRTADRLSLDHHNVGSEAAYKLALQGVEFVDAPVGHETHLQVITKDGFTTDGTLASITMHVGHQEMTFTGAARDSTIFMGSGYDKINFVDHLDVPGQQYWSVIRRPDGELDVYSLFSGNKVQLGGGYKGWTAAASSLMNYGEVEEITLKDARTGGTVTYLPGVSLPNGGERGTQSNIDLRGDGQLFSDSFNHAYFNFIRYTSDNVWAGEATIHNGTLYSTPSDRTVTTAKYGVDAPVLSGTMSVVGQSRNGTHDLIVGEQALGAAIDGHFRLYAFDVDSGMYNQFNQVFLGSSTSEVVNKSGIVGADTVWSNRVALYGFGGNDVLTGGSGRDYIFGGQSVYNQLNVNDNGNIIDIGNVVTGGIGADYFGVGNTNAAGVVTGANSTLTGGFIQGYATDVIMDWHAGTDTLVVLSNGVAVIGGLFGVSGMAGANTIDLRNTYTAIATSDQDSDGARGGSINRLLDAGTNLNLVFQNQQSRDTNSIINEADITVVNNGIIVSRGLGGNDTIYGSVGIDHIYGGDGTNYIYLGNDTAIDLGNDTAIDRAFVDQFIGKQVVRQFDNGDDKIYLNVDSILSAQARILGFNPHFGKNVSNPFQPDYVKDSNYTSFTAGRASAFGLDLGALDIIYFPWSETYLAQLNTGQVLYSKSNGAWRNVSHTAADGLADIALGIAGGVTTGLGTAMLFNPFTFVPGIALVATGASQIAAVITSEPHLNAVYQTPHHLGDYYVNYLTAARTVTTTFNVDDTPLFSSFFWDLNVSTTFAKAVEFQDTGPVNNFSGITTFAVLRSNSETFIYYVQSEDHIVTDDEARLVAEIESLVPITDLVGYLGSLDIYNQTGVVTPIFPQNVSLTTNVDGPVSVSGRMKDASIVLTITLEGNPSTGDTIKIFDGTTLLHTITTVSNVPSYTYTHTFAPPVATPPALGAEKVLNYKVVSKSSQGFTTSSETISLIYDNKAPEIVSVSPAGDSQISVVINGSDISAAVVADPDANPPVLAVPPELAEVRLKEGANVILTTVIDTPGPVSIVVPPAETESVTGYRTFTIEAVDARGNAVSHGTKIFALTTGADGTNSASFIIPEAGAITFALGGDDYIDGTSGNDVLVLGVGTTRQEVDLKDGDDTLIMPSSVVAIVADGGVGTDTVDFSQITQALNINLSTSSFSFIVGGTPEPASILNFENVNGSQGNDVIIGTSAVNSLSGGGGNDTIFGGMGADVLTGGAGTDIFAFSSSAESAASVSSSTTRTFDQITDFTSATDKIQLDAVGAIDFLSSATAVTTAVSVSNVADFAALVTELGALTASTVSVAQVYDVTLTGTGLAASGMTRLVIVNDGDAGLDADDLMIHLSGTSSASILHSDFQFVA